MLPGQLRDCRQQDKLGRRVHHVGILCDDSKVFRPE